MASNRSGHAPDMPGLQTQGTTTSATIDATLRPDLWQLAYNKFSVEEPKLVQKYERMLLKDPESPGNEDLQTKMSSILSRKLNEMASRQWSIKWKGKPRQVRDQIDRIIKVVQIGKDFGSAAAGLDPIHAGLPWAGVCIMLQLFSNDSEEHKSALDNVESVAQIIRRYKAIECIYFPVARPLESPLRIELQDAVVLLYTKILLFQAKAALYFDHTTIRRVAGNVAKLRDWPSIEKEIKSQEEYCTKLCSHIDSAEQSRGMQSLELAMGTMTTQLFELLENADRIQSEKANILDWLSTNRGDSDHEDIRRKLGMRYWESGQWLLQHPSYVSWRTRTDTHCTLWLQGSVGTGKSCLVWVFITFANAAMASLQFSNEHGSSVAVEDCLNRAATSQEQNLAFFYCSNEDPKRKQPVWILRSILAQLACPPGDVAVPTLLTELFKKSKKSPDGDEGILAADNCVTLLRGVISQGGGAVIVIDALDECEDPDELLLYLKEVEDDNACKTRLFLSSRMHVGVSKIYKSCISVSTLGGNEADLGFYVWNEVKNRKIRRLLDGKRPDLETRLIETLSRQAQGMFRWAELQLALFFSSKSRLRHSKDVETKLRVLEKKAGLPELDSVYREIYEMNTEEGSESRAVAVRAYKWILSAYKPLELSELSYAAALRDDGVLDPEVSDDFVLDVRSNFVTIDTSDHAQFAHASVRDFLDDLEIHDRRIYSERMVHTQTTKTCLIYLTSSMFLSAAENELGTGFPAYVRSFWANHCESCEDHREQDNVLRKLLLDFLSLEEVHPGFLHWHKCVTLHFTSEDFRWNEHRPYNVAPFFVSGNRYKKRNMEEECLTPEPSPFLVACVVGVLDVVVKHRTEDQAMLNARNSWSNSGLHLACRFGHLDVALTLLEKGASVDTKDRWDQTPLHLAVDDENEALVRMLLEAGAKVDTKDDWGESPLDNAVWSGSIPLVRMLLDFHAYPAGLEIAIEKHHGDMARLLWDAGARIKPADPQGRTSNPTRYRSTNDLFSLAKRIERIEHEHELDTDSETSQGHQDLQRASDDTAIDYHTPDIADE